LKQFSFAKNKRLVSNKQFKAVLARKLRVSDGLLTLYVAENDCGYARLGVSIGKSCGGAVVRSRFKRLFREAFRQNQDQIPSGIDYLLMISSQWSKKEDKPAGTKKTASEPTYEQVEASFLALAAAAEKQVKR
jgi:ribonuclease P protein component